MRTWIRHGLLLSLLLALLPTSLPGAEHRTTSDSFDRLMREAAIAILREGNRRFTTAQLQHPNLDAARRQNTVTDGQEPFATVLACSDSRVPVELLFDRGIGDLFVIRVAGNVAGPSELASLEYGVIHLQTPLLVVLGHTGCGAVTAVVENHKLHGHLQVLAEKIQPAVIKARTGTTHSTTAELVNKAVEENVWQTIQDILLQSRDIREYLAQRKVIVLGAVYHLDTGEVTWLGPHPAEDQLIAIKDQAGHLPASASPKTPPVALIPATPAPPPPPQRPHPVPVEQSQLAQPVVDPLQSLRQSPLYHPSNRSAKSF